MLYRFVSPMRRVGWKVAAIAVAVCMTGVEANAAAVPTYDLGNGQVLAIQGEVGTGADTAFLDVDFSQNSPAGPAYVWEYHWSGTQQYLSDMISAVAAADSSFDPIPDPAYGNTLIDNFNYGSNIGSADYNGATNNTGDIYWAAYFGPYDPAAKAINWQYSPAGNTSLPLDVGFAQDTSGNILYDQYGSVELGSAQNDMFYGFTINNFLDGNPPTPLLAETSVPEPATLLLGTIAISWGLISRPRRHV